MPITTYAQALAEFSRLCPPSVCPELSTNQNAVDAKQQVAITGSPTSGSMALTLVNPVTLVSGTASIAWNSSAAAAQAALEGLLNVAVGDVTCAGGPLPATPITVQFGGEYAGLAVTLMSATDTFDTGDVVITTLIAGLPVGDVPTILNHWKRGSIWTAETVYELGAEIIPPLVNRNGHRYQAVRYTDVATDQKSGATEPSWALGRDSIIEDGHIVWQQSGDDWGAVLWDFQSAWRDGWIEKAGKATPTTDFVRGEFEMKSSQLFDHCMKQSQRFQPVYCL